MEKAVNIVSDRLFEINFKNTDVEIYIGEQKIGFIRKFLLDANCDSFIGKGEIELVGTESNKIPDLDSMSPTKMTIVIKERVTFDKPKKPDLENKIN